MGGRMRRLVAMTAIASLAVLASMPSAIAGIHEGRFRGQTAQERKVGFRVNRHEEIRSFRIEIKVPGDLGCIIDWDAEDVDEPIHKDGSFVIRGEQNKDTLVVRGRFVSRHRAEGTAKTVMVGPCQGTKRVSWVATEVDLST